MDKCHLFVYNSWLYILFYYTFHHEGLHYDYIEFVVIWSHFTLGLIILLLLECTISL